MKNTSLQKGFTLTETLVAVSIFSGVVIATAPIIHTSLKSSARISEQAFFSESSRTANTIFRTQLANAIYPGAAIEEFGFHGATTNVSFHAIDRSLQDPVHLMFELQSSGDKWALVAKKTDFDEKTSRATLMSSLSNPSFSFYGRINKDDTPIWHTSWAGPKPPQLVRIKGFRNIKDTHAPFLLLAKVNAQTSLHCTFDAVSRACRDES